MNSIFTSFIYFLSKKLNVAPVIIQTVILIIICYVVGEEFQAVLTLCIIFVPIILLISYFMVGKSWFEKPKK